MCGRNSKSSAVSSWEIDLAVPIKDSRGVPVGVLVAAQPIDNNFAADLVRNTPLNSYVVLCESGHMLDTTMPAALDHHISEKALCTPGAINIIGGAEYYLTMSEQIKGSLLVVDIEPLYNIPAHVGKAILILLFLGLFIIALGVTAYTLIARRFLIRPIRRLQARVAAVVADNAGIKRGIALIWSRDAIPLGSCAVVGPAAAAFQWTYACRQLNTTAWSCHGACRPCWRYRHGGDLKIGSYPGASLASTIQREAVGYPRAQAYFSNGAIRVASPSYSTSCAARSGYDTGTYGDAEAENCVWRRYTKNLPGSRRSLVPYGISGRLSFGDCRALTVARAGYRRGCVLWRQDLPREQA